MKTGIQKVRDWRRDNSVTAAELGDLIDRSGSLVLKMETGQELVTIEIAVQLSKITGVPVSQLLSTSQRKTVRAAAKLLVAV